ncbi:MAG: MipA/OmpV family protein [Burkholderiaceae bacterium]|nr:MipA/OmpV family protein [Burkholderiaceae bacterium]
MHGAIAIALLAGCTGAARADQPLWEAGIGVGVLRLPHYRGSDQSHTWVLPVPYFVYRGDILRADRDGARALLVNAERLDVDISVAATAPTRSEDNRARAGMPDLAPTFEIGPNVNFTLARGGPWKLQARLPVRAAFTLESGPDMIGWLCAPNVNVDVRTHGWNVGVLTGPIFGTRRMNGYFFDVAPEFASASRPAYRAPGGYAGWRVVSGVSRRFGEFWTGAFVAADTVRGARFDDSPLVRKRDTVAFGFAVSWVFAQSGQRVARED